MFDIVIAYIVILLVLSTITTAALQLVQRVLPLRWWWLRQQLATLYTQVTGTAKKDAEPLVDELLASAEANPLAHSKPDFVAGPVVRRWLQTKLAELAAARAKPQSDEADPTNEADDAPPVYLEDDDEFQRWWKNTEHQMSSAFRLRVVFKLSVFLGLLLCCVTGLEACGVARHLSQSPAEVEALISDATRSGGGSERDIDDEAMIRLVDRELRRESPGESSRISRAQHLVCLGMFLHEAKDSGDTDLTRAASLELLLDGHHPSKTRSTEECSAQVEGLRAPVARARDALDDGLGFGGYPLSENWMERWLGYFIMALLVALGAPLWFEILSLLRLPLASRPKEPANKG